VKYVSVYKRKDGRPVWYIAYPDPSTGRQKCMATVHRIEDLGSKKKAYDEAMQLAKEAAVGLPADQGEMWESWVPRWLELGFKPRSRQRYETAWKHLRFFLRERSLTCPRAIAYSHAEDYLAWRTAQKRHRGTYVNYNTALTELRFLGSVMREAVRRAYTNANPIAQLGLGRRDVKEKPEITDEEDKKIRAELESRPVWMRECYQIAICQGCRLTETMVPMERVDLARNAITFHGKGGKVFTTQIHPAVRPLAEAKKAAGSRYLCDLPPMPAKEWWTFFREVKLPHLCFHCTKVTVITKLCRAGVPQGVAMSYVNHSREEVHRVYQRLKLADVSSAVSALGSIPLIAASQIAPAPAPQVTSAPIKAPRRKTSVVAS
jgi:hypothetical protein